MRNSFRTSYGESDRTTGGFTSFSRNMNVVRHKPKFDLGPVSQTILIAVLIVAVGLIYVTQGVKASSFDYDIKRVDDEVAELAAKRDDLAAENARLTSISNASSSEVAANMVEAGASGYVTE